MDYTQKQLTLLANSLSFIIMVAPFDQAFHSNNSNVDKHINTRKLSSSFLSLSPHTNKSHEAFKKYSTDKPSHCFSVEAAHF